jgi:hypothetical protein
MNKYFITNEWADNPKVYREADSISEAWEEIQAEINDIFPDPIDPSDYMIQRCIDGDQVVEKATGNIVLKEEIND